MFFIVILLFSLVVWAGLEIALVRHLGLKLWQRLAVDALLLLATQKFWVYFFIGGNFFLPEIPVPMYRITGWACAGCEMLFGLVVLFRIVNFRKPKAEYVPRLRRATLWMVLTAALVSAYGIYEGARVPRIKRVNIQFPDLPEAFNGYRIAMLTDIHCGAAAKRSRTEKIVSATNLLNADAICLTGDLVDGLPNKYRNELEPLRDLTAKDGVFGCTGNHEYYSKYQLWRPIWINEWHIRMLDGESAEIRRGGDTLAIGGVCDEAGAAAPPAARWSAPDVNATFAKANPSAFKILLRHRPTGLEDADKAGVRLQLSGHTHGGAIIGFDLLVREINDHHVRGLYRNGNTRLYLSAGSGQWGGFPLRLGVPSEITEITLVKTDS